MTANEVTIVIKGVTFNDAGRVLKEHWPAILSSREFVGLMEALWQNGSITVLGASVETRTER